MKWRTCLLMIFLVIFQVSLKGQSVSIIPILEEELPSQTVWCTYQDKLGYIWMATKEGLCRYDGTRLNIYRRKDGLWGNNITWISEHEDGNIVVATYKKGLTKVQINHIPTFERIEPSLTVNYDVYLRDSTIYMQDKEFSLKDKTFNNRRKKKGVSFDRRMYPWGKDHFLITSQNNDLVSYQFREGSIESVFSINNDDSFYSIFVNKEQEEVLVGAKSKVYQLKNFQLEKIIEAGLPVEGITNYLLQDQQGTIYAANSKLGLFIKRKTDVSFRGFTKDTPLGNTVINHLMEDNAGNIWLSSWGKGLSMIPHTPFHNYQVEKEIPTNTIQEIHAAPVTGEFFVSSLDDIYKFEPSTQTYIPLHISKNVSGLANYGRILSDQKGNLVIKNYLNDSLIVQVPTSPNFNKKVYALTHLHNAYYSHSGAFNLHYKGEGDTIILRSFDLINDKLQHIQDKKVHSEVDIRATANEPFYFDSLQFWQVFKIGLLKYDFANGNVYNSQQDTTSFFTETIYDAITHKMTARSANEIWFATDKGLISYIDKEWNAYGLEDGLLAETIKDIAFDKEGHIWLATNKGLIYFDRQQFYTFNQKNGLFSNNIYHVEYDLQNNIIYAANNKGVAKVGKTTLLGHFKMEPTAFYLQEISIDGRTPSLNNEVELQAQDRAITFKVALCDFKTIDAAKYEYRLNNQEWFPFEKGVLTLGNLSPDQYEIKFRANKGQHTWVQTPTYTFTVLAKWYQTIYFYLFLLALTILGSYLIARFFINRNQQKAQKEIALNRRIADLEQRALSASMNPHFIFNVLNAIQEYVQKEDIQQTNHYIAKFGQLIRLYLKASLKKNIPLQEELELVEKYLHLEKLRFEDSFNWSLDIDDSLETELFLIPTMIIQPYVENAILHGIRPKGGGTVQISCYEQDDYLYIHISDDGVGISEQQSSSNHLQLASQITQERIQLFGAEINRPGTVKMESTSNKGTTVLIKLPIIIE